MDQLHPSGGAIRLPRMSFGAALEIEGQPALLYASRTESTAGYFGTAVIGQAIPDLRDKSYYWLLLHQRKVLARAVTLKELRALGIGETPYHIYARPFRALAMNKLLHSVNLGFCKLAWVRKCLLSTRQALLLN